MYLIHCEYKLCATVQSFIKSLWYKSLMWLRQSLKIIAIPWKKIITENRTLNSSAGSEIKLNLHLQKQCSVLQCIPNDGKTKQTWKIVRAVYSWSARLPESASCLGSGGGRGDEEVRSWGVAARVGAGTAMLRLGSWGRGCSTSFNKGFFLIYFFFWAFCSS